MLSDELEALYTILSFTARQIELGRSANITPEVLAAIVRFSAQRVDILAAMIGGELSGEETVETMAELAGRLGISRRTLSTYRDQGMPIGTRGGYSVSESRAWMIARRGGGQTRA